MLAVKSGRLAAREILTADEGQRSLSRCAQRRYTRRVGRMCGVFLRMIKMFYDNSGFEVFMTPGPPRDIERAVNNLVAGNTNLGWPCVAWSGFFTSSVRRKNTFLSSLDLYWLKDPWIPSALRRKTPASLRWLPLTKN